MSHAAVSIIIPTLDEAAQIEETLAPLQAWRRQGVEVIVVDGGSRDATVPLARPLADRVLASARGRANQLNAGATAGSGAVLLFLHADTRLPEQGIQAMLVGLQRHGKSWGRFDVRLSGRPVLLRVVERMISLRSRLTGIATGDQAMFVIREAFAHAGGFPPIPLMEDVALSRTLKSRFGRPLCLSLPVATSSRRWEQQGILRTILLMWWLRLAYWLGVAPARLARNYRTHCEHD